VLIYTVGFVGWEIPRTHNQPEETYARTWRQVAAGLGSVDFPLAATVLDELGAVAGEEQFELGLAALTIGLVTNYMAAQP
jgi:hypothetical protein